MISFPKPIFRIIIHNKTLVGKMMLALLPTSVLLSSCKLNRFVEIANITKRSNLTLKQNYQSGNYPKAIMVASNQFILDRSFNHSTYQGFRTAFQQLGINVNKAVHLEIDNAKQNYSVLYKTALENDFKVWILPGYQHGAQLTSFLNANKSVSKIRDIQFIGIDFDVDDNFPQEFKKNFYSYLFDVKQVAFMIGFGAAKYLSETVDDKNQRNISTFGGAPFPGVTDFIRGYLAGTLAFNLKQTDPNKRVGVLSSTKIALNSGFNLGSTMNAAATNAVSDDSQMVMPVAGSGTGIVLNKLKPGQLIVGVDVDQSLVFSKRKQNLFFTSAIKNIAQATYNALADIYGEDSSSASKKSSQQNKNKIFGTYEENLVAYSETKIADPDKKQKATAALNEGKKFFQEDKTKEMAKFLLQPDQYFNDSNIQQHIDDLAQAIKKVFDSNEAGDDNNTTANATAESTKQLLAKFKITNIMGDASQKSAKRS